LGSLLQSFALTKKFVEMHGGRVTVRSDGPGLGSEFEVRLPLSAAPDERRAEQERVFGQEREDPVLGEVRDVQAPVPEPLRIPIEQCFHAESVPEATQLAG
jgi:hypothetical protein